MAGEELIVGTRYAYRARGVDPLVEVELLKIGTQKPARVLVHWIADEFEGKQDWVPPARLKVRWEDRDGFIAEEKRWADIRAPGPWREDVEAEACFRVVELLVDYSVADMYWENGGLLEIRDPAALSEQTGLAEQELLADPLTIKIDARWVVPWPISLKVGHALAQRYADQVADYVEKDEANARHRAVHGQDYGPRDHISAEICREVDEKYAPIRDMLRKWCGAVAIDRSQELIALREEIQRVGLLAVEAIILVEKSGDKKSADDLRRRLGVPVSEAQQARRQTRDSGGL